MPEPIGTAKVGLVQKRAGYDLSKNDFTDAYKNLLDGYFVPVITPNSAAIVDTHGTTASIVADMQVEHGGVYYTVTEAAHTPGIEVLIKFIGVVDFNHLRVKGSYVANTSTHAVAIQLWDFINSAWLTKHTMSAMVFSGVVGSEVIGCYESRIESHAKFISGGEVWLRIIHPMGGNASHTLYIDYCSIY